MRRAFPIFRLLISLFFCVGFWPAQSYADEKTTASDLPNETLVPLLKNFSKSCIDSMKGAKFAERYCPCAAAMMADRFSLDELTDEKASTPEGMEKLHPGIVVKLTACALAAKGSE